MSRISKIMSHEESEHLLGLMKKEKHLLKCDRLQTLYLLKGKNSRLLKNQVSPFYR